MLDGDAARALQLSAGFRRGNVTDWMTFLAFWDALPSDVRLHVEIDRAFEQELDPLPGPHQYVTQTLVTSSTRSAVLVGTPATVDAHGAESLFTDVGPRLEVCHQAGVGVDAVGVGIDRPTSAASRDRLSRLLVPIRSWSVRSPDCRDVLVELGVDRDRIIVGSDWLWLYRRRDDPAEWAADEWRRVGIDPRVPFIVVDLDGAAASGATRVAEALDRLSASYGFQVALMCGEPGFDAARERISASSLRALMKRPAVVVQTPRWTPDEWLALLARSTATLSCRYQFVIQSVLAETHAVALPGSPGFGQLLDDVHVAQPRLSDDFEPDQLVCAVAEGDRARSVALLQDARRRLEARAQNNLAWWPCPSSEPTEIRRRADVVERMCSMLWYHRIEIMPGVVTPGQRWDELWDPIRRRHAEVDFRDRSVLEIGCWDGYWSFEAERMGAREIWATDDMSQRRSVTRTVPFVIESLQSRVQYRDDVSVYDVDERFDRTFDVVIFYGVLYHLRYPALAIAKLRRVLDPGGLLLLETAVLPEVEEPIMRWGYRTIYPSDPSSWNALSLSCLTEMLTSSYFEVEVCEAFLRYGHIGRGYVRARAVGSTEPDKHPVPDRFLGDIARRSRRAGGASE